MFSQYLPQQLDAAWENVISPVRRRKHPAFSSLGIGSSGIEPLEATTCKVVMLKQQHLRFGPKKDAGVSTFGNPVGEEAV